MTDHDDRQQDEIRRAKVEVLRRFTEPTLRHDEEDIEFWRNASDELRGRTLYKLLARGKLIRASVGKFFEDEAPKHILKSRRDGQEL